ncbi:MAG: zf-HC2 domain-containing protein [Blastocatellia bacterium]|nr:zf-HC2 domain-containing protein [Blastocatellia bacterium]
MKTGVDNNCGKKDLLVTYLYDEASQTERTEFEQHLIGCGSCHNELQAFKGLREELGSWQMPFVPHIEVVTPRTAMDALRELVRLVPGWFKVTSGLAAAAAATLVIFALTGTRVSFGNGGFDAQFGVKEITQVAGEKAPPQTAKPLVTNSISRAEAEQMIQAAVTQAQQQTQLQLANLETKLNAAHQAQLQTATQRLRQEHQRRLQIELAKFDNGARQSLSEWLLTATETGQEVMGNEKNQ